MGKININGRIYNFTGADATNNIIKADNGKYYQKGPKGYREIKQNGQSIFNTTAKKSANAANYNKKSGFEPNKKYYVVGNSSYFTMVDKNYNTLYYKDNQRITKEKFLQGANCVYDAKSKRYIARDAKNISHKYATKFRQTVKDSKTGRYFVVTKGGQRKYFEANGKEISERAFLDIEKAYIDSDGKIAKYDWKAKAKNAAKGIGNMFADMFTEEVPVYQKDKNGKILLDRNGQPITEKNKDGSPKTHRKFSLSRTCTTIVVGGAIATACVLAAPFVTTVAVTAGIGASTAATMGTIAGLGTQLGIAGYFGYEGGKQMYNANEENKNVLLSNNERMENWKKKGAGGAQVGMSLMMAKGAVKNAPKTHATARNTAKAIETKNNATLMAKGKVGLRDRISNARSGFSETVGWKALKKGVGDYHKNNSLKTKVADVAKAPLKLTKEAVMEPIRLATGTVKGGARLVTKKGRAKIKGDIKEWKNSFKENPQNTPVLTPEQVKTQQEANAKFKQSLADMPKDNKVQQYESLIKKTTDKNQVAQLLDAIKNDKDLTKAQKAEVATKFFEKNDAQYPGVLDAGKRQKAELGLDKAKTLEDIKKVDREALPAKKQKVFDKKKAEFEKKNSQKVKSVIKDINNIKEPAKLDAKIEELSKEKFFDKVSEAQANEVRSAIRKKQAEIETSGIKEANENVAVTKKQNVYTRAKNWWKNQKVKSVIKDINKIKEPAKLDAKIEELANEKFFDKVSEAQANEVRSAIRKRQAEIETSGIKEANENSIGKKQKLDEHKSQNSENSFAKFEDMIAKSDDMSQVRAKLSNNLEFNKLSQAEQRQLIAKINQREIEIVDMKNTFANFEEMIAKADDLSKVQAKLSNNPEFNKLSNADKRKLLEKLNKRKAELEAAASKSTPKETPKDKSNTSKTTGYSNNLFNNVKDMKTPTLGGLNAVKSVDENVVKPLEDVLNSTLDPNQQYAYAEPPVQEDSIVEESSKVDSENEVTEEPPVQEGGDAEKTNAPEDNENIENQNEADNTEETNESQQNENPSNSSESNPPVNEEPKTPAPESPSPATTPKTPTPSTNSTDGNTPSKQNVPVSDSVNNNSNIKQGQVSQTTPANNTNKTNKPNMTEKDTVSQVETKKQEDKTVQNNTQEERDIPPAKKAEITQKVQDAKNDDEINAALLDLREVGRFKGRKNLRRLLKAKRKYNKELAENDTKKAKKYQERIDKYQEKVNENIDQINEAYKKKKFEA